MRLFRSILDLLSPPLLLRKPRNWAPVDSLRPRRLTCFPTSKGGAAAEAAGVSLAAGLAALRHRLGAAEEARKAAGAGEELDPIAGHEDPRATGLSIGARWVATKGGRSTPRAIGRLSWRPVAFMA